MSESLFTPIKVGDVTLKHRVVMCPLTRFRANDQYEHTDMATEYYSQRASEPGTLLITEAAFIASQAGGYENVPGCYNDEQIAAWKKIVDAVHAKGSYIYLQLWALGRTASAENLKAEGGYDLVSASDIPLADGEKPRPLTTEEVKEYVQLYAQAAKNFVQGAGGDGVEIHGANGYLVDQFTQTNSNIRTDAYGGSVENRSRFCLEVVEAVSAAVGQEKTGLRISPFSHFQGMRMSESDLFETFTHLVTELKRQYPKMAYLHAVTPRIAGNTDIECPEDESLDFLHKIWDQQPLILAGSYKPESAKKDAAAHSNVLIAFGRDFISNPDLPRRIKEGIELTKYDRDTFYSKGPKGYTDYPFAK